MEFGLFRIDIVPFLLGLVIMICLFLLFRAVVLWYWKIDKIVGLLEKIERHTRPVDEKTEDVIKK